MEKNLKYNANASYSDLFEDFFRSDAIESVDDGCRGTEDLFTDLLGITEDKTILQSISMQSTNPSTDFYAQQQQQQSQPFYYQYPTMIPTLASSVAKPGFVRNRTRKNMRQKSVASAVKASHLMATVNTMGFQQLPQQYQQPQQHIPYYQAAAQIPSFQMHPAQQQQQQSVPVLLAAKSPAAPQMTFARSSHPASPSSARSPNSNSSDYVKFRLQQKIRSRMVSKGQVPPNPTEEELRMCGVQMQMSLSPVSINHQNIYHNRPQQQMVTISQLPTPKQSPQQIPRAFNNNVAAFIAAPAMIPNQSQYPIQEDYTMYNSVDMSGYCQKDPLSTIDPSFNNFKHQQMLMQQQATDSLYPPQAQIPQIPQQQSQQENGTVNYDQFFSDFILY